MDPRGEPSGLASRSEPAESFETPGTPRTLASTNSEGTDSARPVAPAPTQLGHYELLGELGRGGMGVVYKARNPLLDRIVALKTLRTDDDTDPEQLQRFEREMHAAARLYHPNIIPIYEVSHAGQPFFTMPYLTGGSLAKHRQRLTNDRDGLLVMMEKIARAIHYAHEQGVLHRDLKPANVLLDDRGEPYVGDFGLAKVCDGFFDLTRTGMILGTPSYMAPEQAAGHNRRIGPHTDVWALGVMLYELLVGRRPFVGDSNDTVKEMILGADPPTPRSLRGDIDPALEAVILSCLEKDPARRCPSALLLADNLARYRQGERPQLPPVPLGRRLRQTVRRRPVRVIVVVAFLLALPALVVSRLSDRLPPAPPPPPVVPPTVLLGASGPPEALRWLIKAKEPILHETRPGEPFSFQADGLCVLDLGAMPAARPCRIEAEVRHDAALISGSVGIIVTESKFVTKRGNAQTMWRSGFADLGNSAGVAEFGLTRYEEKYHILATASLLQGPMDHFGANAAAPWRRLILECGSDRWSAFLDGVCRGDVSDKDARQKHKNLLVGALNVPTTPEQRIGVYVSGGRGSFRNIVVQTSPEQEK